MVKKILDMQEFRRALDEVIITISRKYAVLTAGQLLDLIVKMKIPGLDNSPWMIESNIEGVVQKLVEEGKVVGRLEQTGFFHSNKFFFDVEANFRPFLENQSKITQNIKRTVLDLGTKFTRLQVAEIAESCQVEEEALIIATIQDMIAKHQVDAQYFASTKAIAFNQQANLASQDAFIAELEAEFADWGRKGQAGKAK